MRINTSKLSVFLLAISFLFCPRDVPVNGLHSYRLVLLLILLINIKKLRIDKKLFNIITLIYVAYISIAYLLGDGVMSFAGFIIDTAGVLLATTVTLDSKARVSLFAKYICGCAIVYSILCIIESFTGINIFRMIAGIGASKMRYGFYRAVGVANHSINNGLILALMVCLLLYFKSNISYNTKKLNIAIILTTVACVFTFSRTSLIGLIIIYFLVFVEKGGLKFIVKYKNKSLVIFAILVALFSLSGTARSFVANLLNMFKAVFNDEVAESITSSFGSNAGGIGERLDLYKWIYQDMGNHHLFGVGANTTFAHDFQMTVKTVRTKSSIENQYLKMFYYFGYVGLSIFVMFIISNIIRAVKNKKKNSIYVYSFNAIFALSICWFFVASVDDLRWILLFVALMYIVPKLEKIESRVVV